MPQKNILTADEAIIKGLLPGQEIAALRPSLYVSRVWPFGPPFHFLWYGLLDRYIIFYGMALRLAMTTNKTLSCASVLPPDSQ